MMATLTTRHLYIDLTEKEILKLLKYDNAQCIITKDIQDISIQIQKSGETEQ